MCSASKQRTYITFRQVLDLNCGNARASRACGLPCGPRSGFQHQGSCQVCQTGAYMFKMMCSACRDCCGWHTDAQAESADSGVLHVYCSTLQVLQQAPNIAATCSAHYGTPQSLSSAFLQAMGAPRRRPATRLALLALALLCFGACLRNAGSKLQTQLPSVRLHRARSATERTGRPELDAAGGLDSSAAAAGGAGAGTEHWRVRC